MTEHVLEEAERIVQDAWLRRCLVVAERTQTSLPRGGKLEENETYTLVPPIAGGG